MVKHTPGPWSFAKMPCGIATVGYVEDYRIGPDYGSPDMADYSEHGNAEDDARLIAAAPELAEACATFVEWLRREEAGGTNEPWSGKRDTLEGEAAWRAWYCENLRICDLAQTQARAALEKAGYTPNPREKP